MSKKLVSTIVAGIALSASFASFAARDYIEIVGSSTVYPFATVVAERFGRATDFRTPKIEATGSGGGLKLFCQGVGASYPDITNSSRRIKHKEVEQCYGNGVRDIVEVLIGFDGIVLGNAIKAPPMPVTRRDLFLALAHDVPNPDGSPTLVKNPYKTWKQINRSLPNKKIEVLGPPPTSGTRDAFVELGLEGGCKTFPFIKAIKKTAPERFKAVCHRVREDGPFIEAGENDNLIVQKLNSNPNAFGIFGFSFLDQNSDTIKASPMDGFQPSFESIANGQYPVSRPLYFYVKKAHVDVIPGIREYLAEFTSNKSWGDEGYLTEKGMIPLSKERRETIAKEVKALKNLQM